MPSAPMDEQAKLNAVVECLQATMLADMDSIREAERQLGHFEATDRSFPSVLVSILTNESVDRYVRESASVFFKNLIKRHWEDESDEVLPPDHRTMIKENVIDLMLSVHPKLRRNLAEAVTIISRHDFPENWQELLPMLMERMDPENLPLVNAILTIISSVLKRYRGEMKTKTVNDELFYILQLFQDTMLALWTQACSMLNEANDSSTQLTLLTTLLYLCRIFYSINSVDLAEHFEDNMEAYMSGFHALLNFETEDPALIGDSEDETGVLTKIQTSIMRSILIYVNRYDTEFADHVGTFVMDACTFLLRISPEPKYDRVATATMEFIGASSCGIHAEGFREEGFLARLCEEIILPNVLFTENDEILFEETPNQYITRDLQGSDGATRRRSAVELIKALRKNFEDEVTGLYGAKINGILEEYAENPQENWRHKDLAIFLVLSLAAKGVTANQGATELNSAVPLESFIDSQILVELNNPPSMGPNIESSDSPSNPLLQADALKFLTMFRQHMPKESFQAILPRLSVLLTSTNAIVHSYAAHCLDKFLLVKDVHSNGTVTKRWGEAEVAPLAAELLTNLTNVLEMPGSKENDHVMRALKRVLNSCGSILEYVQELSFNLVKKLGEVAANPSNPQFNHHLFETIALVVRKVTEADEGAANVFIEMLFPPFHAILAADVPDFTPYTFQIMAMLLEKTADVPESYVEIFPNLLSPPLWMRSANVPALVRLLKAYIKHRAPIVYEHLSPVLGVFQKLVSSKQKDHEGFFLLESLLEFAPREVFDPHLNTIFAILFKRLENRKSKTNKYLRSLLVFLSFFVCKRSPSELFQTVNGLNDGLMVNVVKNLFCQYIRFVSGRIERKLCSVGMTRLLCDCPEMLQSPYIDVWGELLSTNVAHLELAEVVSNEPEEDDDEEPTIADFDAGSQFAKLSFAVNLNQDPLPDVRDAKLELATSLERLSKQHPGQIMGLVQQQDEAVGSALIHYFQAASIAPPYLA